MEKSAKREMPSCLSLGQVIDEHGDTALSAEHRIAILEARLEAQREAHQKVVDENRSLRSQLQAQTIRAMAAERAQKALRRQVARINDMEWREDTRGRT